MFHGSARRPAPLVLALLLSTPLFAHDGDPKLRDRQPHYPGPGIRTGVPRLGSVIAATGTSFPASGVTLLAWLSLDDFNTGASSGNVVWGYVSPSGREYALMGLSSGTAFVEVTDPNDPVIVAHRTGPDSLWRDIKVWQHYAYAVSEGGSGIQVFDIAGIDSGQVTFVGTVTAGGDTATHTLALDTASGYLYRSGGGSNGLRIYNLNASPTAPPQVGSWSNKYVHEAQIVTYTSGPAAGKQIAYCCGGFNGGFTNTGLSVLDVTNKSSIQVLKEVFWSNPGYSHQIWLSPNQQFAYLNDELDENGTFPTTTYVFNVSTPASTTLLGSFNNGNSAVGHNLYTKGNLIYESNYRSGLRVFDATNPTAPVEAYWFDTYPSDDVASFNGLWSNYPYLPSGIVLGSDIEKGLFVWWVGPPLLDIATVGPPPTLISPGGDSFLVQINEIAPGTLAAGTAKLHFDAGAGLQSTDLVALGGSTWQADFPALPCGGTVAFFVSADSTNGITWSWPAGGAVSAAQATVAFGEATVFSDDLETNQGWTVGATGDNATTGIWVRVDPVGSAAQPEDDHTSAPGIRCWVTGQGQPGGGVGDNDVDNGTTTVLSPLLDLTGLSLPVISYWRWYSNNANLVVDDTFLVEVSNGGAWVQVELLGPSGQETTGGWFFHQFSVADFVAPNATVRVRFRASDLGQGSIVEAAVDDFQVKELNCSGGGPTIYCTGKLSSQGCVPQVGFSGSPSASNPSPFDVNAALVVPGMNGILFYGHGADNTPFQGGILCALPPIVRTSLQVSGGAAVCSGAYHFDFNALIQSGSDPSLVAGWQVNAQYWFRDPPASFGSGLSDALEFVIQP